MKKNNQRDTASASAARKASPKPAKPARKAAAKTPANASKARGKPSGTKTAAGEPARTVLRQFRMIFNAVRAHFSTVEKASGVAGAQVWALSVVASRPGVTDSELAKAMDIHQSTASNLERALSGSELVRTVRNSDDRRVVTLTATAAGKALLKRAPQPFGGLLPAALAQMDSAALARMQRDLGALVALVDPDTRAARKPLADM